MEWYDRNRSDGILNGFDGVLANLVCMPLEWFVDSLNAFQCDFLGEQQFTSNHTHCPNPIQLLRNHLYKLPSCLSANDSILVIMSVSNQPSTGEWQLCGDSEDNVRWPWEGCFPCAALYCTHHHNNIISSWLIHQSFNTDTLATKACRLATAWVVIQFHVFWFITATTLDTVAAVAHGSWGQWETLIVSWKTNLCSLLVSPITS